MRNTHLNFFLRHITYNQRPSQSTTEQHHEREDREDLPGSAQPASDSTASLTSDLAAIRARINTALNGLRQAAAVADETANTDDEEPRSEPRQEEEPENKHTPGL